MKKLFPLITISTLLMSAIHSTKTEAGIILVAAGVTMVNIASHDRDGDGKVDKKEKICYDDNNCITLNNSNTKIETYKLKPIGMATATTGAMLLPFFGYSLILGVSGVFLPVSIAMVVLDENGSTSKDQIESILMNKYPFLDHESAQELSLALSTKAGKTSLDKNGTKIISLTENEVKSILEPQNLRDEEVLEVIHGLK